MASKYLQKYPVPAGFEEILHDFAREVLRDQPDNIVEYAASYFEMMEQGKKFDYESKFNVKRQDKKQNLKFNSKAAQELSKKAANAVNSVNQNIGKEKSEKGNDSREQKRPDSHKSNQASGIPQPSIRNLQSEENNNRPESGHTHNYQVSSQTLMDREGHRFVSSMNQGAYNQVAQQQIQPIGEENQSQLQASQLQASQLASNYMKDTQSILDKFPDNSQKSLGGNSNHQQIPQNKQSQSPKGSAHGSLNRPGSKAQSKTGSASNKEHQQTPEGYDDVQEGDNAGQDVQNEQEGVASDRGEDQNQDQNQLPQGY